MTDAMIASRTESADRAAIDRALRENGAGETIPGEVAHAILDGTPPLRAWRRHRRLTLGGLAARVGVTKGYLSQIENGRKSGTLDLVRRLAAALGVTLDDLAGWRDADDDGP
ncbi:MAG: helix-turn-helix transcriptional regulator [Acidobacteria bacterium]|nr:helix-turn-helix transcriptional regulator [Acidobacteriota bacterium]